MPKVVQVAGEGEGGFGVSKESDGVSWEKFDGDVMCCESK